MSTSPTSKEVLTLLSEWLEAKRTEKEADKKPTPAKSSGGFNYFSGGVSMNPFWDGEGGANDRDEGDEDTKVMASEADQAFARAQLALDLYVSVKVEEALQLLINQSNERQQGHRPEHQLYPERG